MQGGYYQHDRKELSKFIDEGENSVLELGCAEGAFGASLKQAKLASNIVGIELFPEAAKVAKSRLDYVICGDIEILKREELELSPESFDYVICGDVIEHLRDPWEVLSWLTTLLKEDGKIIISVPNVRHWSVSFPLFFNGSWQYRSQGILDRTHLRFFTQKSLSEIVTSSGLDIEVIQTLMHRRVDKIGSKLAFGLLDGLFGFQWLVVAKRKKCK